MTRVTAILNHKGGIGKTTTAHALSSALTLNGYKVLAIDADGQSNLTLLMKGERNAPGIYEAMNEGTAPNVQHTAAGDLLGANSKLNKADRQFISRYEYTSLKEAIAPLLPMYDHVIIDCPPSTGVMNENAIEAATDLIIPVQPAILAAAGLVELFRVIDSVRRKDNPGLSIAGLLYTLVDKRTTAHREYMEQINELAEANGIPIYETIIYTAIALQEAQTYQTSIYEYDPKSPTAKQYALLTKEYLLQEVNR